MWQQLELVFELEFDLQNTVDSLGKCDWTYKGKLNYIISGMQLYKGKYHQKLNHF